MKRRLAALLLVTLLFTLLIPSGTMAASKNRVKSIYIMTINSDGARVRASSEGGGANNVLGSLRKGTKVFYLGKDKAGSWYRVATQYGQRGYVFRDFLDYYGVVPLASVYEANGSARLYKKASTTSGVAATLKDGEYVILIAASGEWASVYTLSGQRGCVKLASLRAAD